MSLYKMGLLPILFRKDQDEYRNSSSAYPACLGAGVLCRTVVPSTFQHCLPYLLVVGVGVRKK